MSHNGDLRTLCMVRRQISKSYIDTLMYVRSSEANLDNIVLSESDLSWKVVEVIGKPVSVFTGPLHG